MALTKIERRERIKMLDYRKQKGLWQHRCSRRSVNKIPLQGKHLNVLLNFGLFPCNGIRLQYLQNEEKCENP